jgi:hypothetical protein
MIGDIWSNGGTVSTGSSFSHSSMWSTNCTIYVASINSDVLFIVIISSAHLVCDTMNLQALDQHRRFADILSNRLDELFLVILDSR